MTTLLVVLAVAFAISMGAHYTGACMGMPRALHAVTAWQALLIMAPLTFVGAALASHQVAHTVGFDLLRGRLGIVGAVIVIAVALALTSAFNVLRVPTSTIQILVFTVAGVALAAGIPIAWPTIGLLAIVWVCAPVVAAGLGFALTRSLDLTPLRAGAADPHEPHGPPDPPDRLSRAGWLGWALVAVGAAASFTMGANDVANATGVLVGIGTFGPLLAGIVGGAGLAVGVLTWGRPLLNKVAFDVVTLDRPMATAAQLVQAAVVLTAVAFGLFTSLNQALIGAMTGAGVARGRRTVHRASLVGILRGWVIGPAAGIAAGFLVAAAAHLAGAALTAR